MSDAALDLPGDRLGIHRPADIVGRDDPNHLHRAGGRVHLHQGGLGGVAVGEVLVARFAERDGGRRAVDV